uniref:NADH-ubiquinone oxidoreductase chain 6 n=1 Tax=Laonastes aenigmamus TaxID=340180 RepID=A0A342KAS2_9HYST|nr:NADH dehydrogenase subunit 6 [Laonastes aenigmamus]
MAYVMLFLSSLFVVGFISFSVKPSPIFGGVGLIISGGVGCSMLINYGGSFLGLIVFLIYLGGMLVVFGYTTAMATDQYPEGWGSSVMIRGVLLLGLVFEGLLLFWLMEVDYLGIAFQFSNMGEWILYDDDKAVGFFREDSTGVAAMYSCNYWLMVVAGWSLFVGIFIAIEVTRGN